MTSVRFRFREGDGTPIGAPGIPGAPGTDGAVIFVPIARYVDALGVTLPVPFAVTLVAPVTVADIPPSGAGWCWVAREVVEGIGRTTRYVIVPDTAVVLDYELLTDVIPESFTPTVEALDGWVATLAAVELLANLVDADALDAASAAASATAAAAIAAAAPKWWTGTQVAYTAITTPDPGTLYLIVG